MNTLLSLSAWWTRFVRDHLVDLDPWDLATLAD
jgi:hypothetical protein